MKKRSIVNRVLIVGMALTMGLSLTACGEATSTKSSASSDDKKEIVLGIDDTFVPMGFKDENGDLVGFDVELAKAVGEKTGVDIKFQAIDWSMKESELNSGNIDAIWNGYSVTDERKNKVDFSDVYLKNKQVIVTLSDSEIKTKADLKGRKVGAQNESSAVDAIEAEEGIEESFDGGKLITYETNNDALMDLENKRIDAIVADEILVRYYMNERGEDKYKILDDDFGDEDYAIGVKKGNTELKDKINEGLKKCNEDGTSAKISEKWFGSDIVVK